MIRLAVDCEAVVRQLRIAFRLASAADSPCNCHRRQRRRPDGGGVLPGRGCAAAGNERGADVAGYRQRLCRRGGKQGERAEQQRGSGWEVQTGARCPNLSTPYELSTGIRLGPGKHTRAPSPVRGKRILRQKKRVLRQKKRVLMIECLSSPLERRIPGVPAATGRDRLPPGHPQRCHPLLPAQEPALRARFDGAHLETRASSAGARSCTTRSWRPRRSTGCSTATTSSTSAATATGCGATWSSPGPSPRPQRGPSPQRGRDENAGS